MKVIDKIGLHLGSFLRCIIRIDPNQGKLRYFPDPIIWFSTFVSLNSLLQAVSDYTLEILSVTGIIFKIPFRFEFLCLTFISAVLGYFTLEGLKHRELDVTRNSIFLGFVVEFSLVLGDLYFIFNYPNLSPQVVASRIPFMIMTSINIVVLGFIVLRGRVFGFGSNHPYELN